MSSSATETQGNPLVPPGLAGKDTPEASLRQLSTLQRNALAQFLQRRDFSPCDIAQLEYAQVARLPKVGRKGLDAIRAWLGGHGLDLRNPPETGREPSDLRGELRLDRAVRLLRKNGYAISPPATKPDTHS